MAVRNIYDGRMVLTNARANMDQMHIKFEILTELCDDFKKCENCRYLPCISYFCTAGFILCEILCKVEAVLFPVLRHIVCIATTIVIRLNDHVNVIHTFGFTGRQEESRDAKYLHPCLMDSSVLNEFVGSPRLSLDCITSVAVPPLSTCMMASRTFTYSEIPFSLAYLSTIG